MKAVRPSSLPSPSSPDAPADGVALPSAAELGLDQAEDEDDGDDDEGKRLPTTEKRGDWLRVEPRRTRKLGSGRRRVSVGCERS